MYIAAANGDGCKYSKIYIYNQLFTTVNRCEPVVDKSLFLREITVNSGKQSALYLPSRGSISFVAAPSTMMAAACPQAVTKAFG
jgi:hypothetical protein